MFLFRSLRWLRCSVFEIRSLESPPSPRSHTPHLEALPLAAQRLIGSTRVAARAGIQLAAQATARKRRPRHVDVVAIDRLADADQPFGQLHRCSVTTVLRNTPIPLISTSKVSPGFMAWVVPGVPVKITSPGSSVTYRLT